MASFDARALIEHQLRNLAQVRGLTEADVQRALTRDPKVTDRMAEHLAGKARTQARELADWLLRWPELDDVAREAIFRM